jgi:hypothetical protein
MTAPVENTGLMSPSISGGEVICAGRGGDSSS